MYSGAIVLSLAASAAAFAPTLPAGTRQPALALRMAGTSWAVPKQKLVLTPQLFKQLDTDKSGTLDISELMVRLDKKQAEALIGKADANGDGVLDYGEYRLRYIEDFEEELSAQTAAKSVSGERWNPFEALMTRICM